MIIRVFKIKVESNMFYEIAVLIMVIGVSIFGANIALKCLELFMYSLNNRKDVNEWEK